MRHVPARPTATAQVGVAPTRTVNHMPTSRRVITLGTAALALCALFACVADTKAAVRTADEVPGAAGEPHPQMPAIAAIGERTGKYIDVPETAKGPAVDPAKGYRLQDLGRGLYMVTDNAYQSMLLVYDRGVVVIDAPPAYAARLPQAIAEVTDKPITHVVYSHSHADHIGGARALGGQPIIVAHDETARLLKRAADPNRPLPTVAFADRYTLRVGAQVLELSYHGNAHEPGNIFIHAPLDWDTLVGGHVARTGTHADVDTQAEFNRDVKQAAATALATTKFGVGLNPRDGANPWAGFDNYIDRVAGQCVNTLTPKWSSRLAGFDVYVWDQCYAMEQSLRIE